MMKRLVPLSGAAAALLFFTAVYGLSGMLEGYSHTGQTVSEIGRAGSPAETHWRVAKLLVAAGLLAFAASISAFARTLGVSQLPAAFIAFFAVSVSGMGLFATPHPLHNLFGLSALVGYMAPLVTALTWRRHVELRTVAALSAIAWCIVVLAIVLNLSPLFAPALYPLEYYGVVQRGLFVAHFGWCFYLSLAIFGRSRRRVQATAALK
jgi:hypothetical protein